METIEHRTQMRRFNDVPYLVLGHDARWNPGVRAFEQWRLDERRHPYFDRGSAAYFLARQDGRPIGRIVAHIPHSGATAGCFGFYDAPDDADVAAALLDAARAWLADQGATSMAGPLSWTADESCGVPTRGADLAGATGREWKPAWYAENLAAAGLTAGPARPTFRLVLRHDSAAPDPTTQGQVAPRRDRPSVPAQAGRFADARLVLPGIAAVPDVTDTLRTASLRSAWSTARQARERQFETATVVRLDGEPDVVVPHLMAVAGRAGYRYLISPWAPAGHEVETEHRVFSESW